MLFEIKIHTVPYFKALVYGKVEFYGLDHAATFTCIVKLGHLVHKMGFIQFHSDSTVYCNKIQVNSYDFCLISQYRP